MNTQGCPVGFATDDTFLPALTPGSCEVDLNVYDGVMSSLLILRVLFGVLVWYDWWARKQARVKKASRVQDKRHWENRFPFIPTLSSAVIVVQLLMILLVRFDQSNAGNGVTFMFWTLGFLAFGIYSLIFQRRIIRLGKRVIPMARANLEELDKIPTGADQKGANNTSFESKRNWDDLASFDQIQVAILVVQFLSQVVQLLCGLVLGLVFPGAFVWLQVAFISESVYIFGNVFSLIYQLERVFGCVLDSQMDDATKDTIRKKFRSQQLHFSLIGTAGIAVGVLLTTGVFPARWYMMVLWLAIEGSVASLAAIDAMWSLCLRKSKPVVDQASSPARAAGADLVLMSNSGGSARGGNNKRSDGGTQPPSFSHYGSSVGVVSPALGHSMSASSSLSVAHPPT